MQASGDDSADASARPPAHASAAASSEDRSKEKISSSSSDGVRGGATRPPVAAAAGRARAGDDESGDGACYYYHSDGDGDEDGGAQVLGSADAAADGERGHFDSYGFPIPDAARASYEQWLRADVQSAQLKTASAARFFDLRTRGKMLSEVAVTRLFARGFPQNYRKRCWCSLLRVDERIEHYPGKFRALVDQPFCDEDRVSVSDIRKDVARAFPAIAGRRDKYNEKIHNVLLAYARYNRTVGYAQGMNFLAGAFLVFMDSERAFWALCSLLEDRLPNYFSPQLFGSKIDLKIFEMYVRTYLTALSARFKQLQFSVELLAFEWFMCLFTKNLPAETAFRIWDAFLYDGPSALFSYGIRVIKSLEPRIMQFPVRNGAFTEVILFIQQEMAKMYDFDALTAIVIDPPLSNGNIEMWRLALKSRLKKKNRAGKPAF